MKKIISIALLIISLNAVAQKTEQFVDFWMKPSNKYPFYLVTKEQRNGKWYTEVTSVQDGSLVSKSEYRDEALNIHDGEETTYHDNGKIKAIRHYRNGVKDGVWLNYHSNGRLEDSAVYRGNIRTGTVLGWDENGYLTDSLVLDANGSGPFYNWYPGGGRKQQIVGAIESDSIRANRWTYYHDNGKTWAVVDFKNGKQAGCQCYDATGKQLAADLCVEREANFKGGAEGWIAYMQRKLNGNVPVKAGAPKGIYTVIVLFKVNTDGTLTDLKAQTNYGFGMEQEALRVLKNSPKWVPAIQFGKPVNAWRRQPISFGVIE